MNNMIYIVSPKNTHGENLHNNNGGALAKKKGAVEWYTKKNTRTGHNSFQTH